MVKTATNEKGDKSKRRHQHDDKMAWSKRRQCKTAKSQSGDKTLSQMIKLSQRWHAKGACATPNKKERKKEKKKERKRERKKEK